MDEHTRRVAETVASLLKALEKHNSFLLTFTPIHDPSKTTADTHFQEAISICYVTSENTKAIAVSAGFHEAKVSSMSDYLHDMHVEMVGNDDTFRKGFHLGQAVSQELGEAETYLRYRTDIDSDTDTDSE